MLKKLIDPISEEEFFSEYWEKKPLFIQRQDPSYFSGLMSFEDLDEILTGREILEENLRVIDTPISKCYAGSDLSCKLVYHYYGNDKTVVLKQVQSLWGPVRKFCYLINKSFRFISGVCANAYLTQAETQGFVPHYDTHEVFIVQLEGSKLWKLYDTLLDFPMPNQPVYSEFPQGTSLGSPTMEVEMFPGDVLYIPGGLVHEAKCFETASLHLTLGWDTVTFAGLLDSQAKAFSEKFPEQQVSIPFASYFLGAPTGGEKEKQEAQKWVESLVDQYFEPSKFSMALRDISGDWRAGHEVFLEGQLRMADSLRKGELSLNSLIAPRDPFIPYSCEKSEEGFVNLSFHDTNLRVSQAQEEIFRHILSIEKCRVKDLPGDLSDNEKLDFIRLMVMECVVSLSITE
ncbi:MAG: ribosomal protein L16 Arg81 hydroxylase [Chlamydiales bacterium]|jgi:ribosomal protein L16 Arg81 hydroxylase